MSAQPTRPRRNTLQNLVLRERLLRERLARERLVRERIKRARVWRAGGAIAAIGPSATFGVSTAYAYAWLAARARNAVRRRGFMSIVFGVTFVAALIGIVLIPRQASRTASQLTRVTQSAQRPDTALVIAERTTVTATIARVDSMLDAARRAIAQPTVVPTVIDTISPELKVVRDSLRTLLTALTSAMARAAASPLPPAFRELGETPALASVPQVRVWLDSLDQVDKLRAPFGALGAGDPIYVSLTARLNELGRSIRDAAELKRSELRARLAPLLPMPMPPERARAPVDTMSLWAERAVAQQRAARATSTLMEMRRTNARIDSLHVQARELANIDAPPLAMLGSALVIGLAIAFASAFGLEVRHPRISHLREAEAVADTRVLAVIRPREVVERSRRQSDLAAPPLIDIVSESYRTLYLHLAATGANIPSVTVTGDLPSVVATIAANLAAVAAYEARSTLLVDADPVSASVAAVLRIPATPGLMGVLEGTSSFVDATVSTTIGRDRPLDILPSGHGRLGTVPSHAIERVRDDLMRVQSRYDLLVLAAPTSYTQLATNTIIPTQDVIFCARLGETRLADLRAAMQSLRGVGRIVHGIVLWDDDIPRLTTHQPTHG